MTMAAKTRCTKKPITGYKHNPTSASLITAGKKGSVEQVNGLIRRFIPKGTDFSEISHKFINKIDKLLNNRPKRCLNYQTPYEVFRKHCGALPS